MNKNFIKDLKNKIKNNQYIDWYYISAHQKLSKEFIREFADGVDWYYIFYRQKLSEDFIKKFYKKITKIYKIYPFCFFNLMCSSTHKTFI